MAGNSNLKDSFKNKQDEFYTDISLVENELKHYREHFRDKIIFCNCDDPYESEFFKYFAVRFNSFGLKKLIATNYCGSPVAGKEFSLFDEVEEISAKKPSKLKLQKSKIGTATAIRTCLTFSTLSGQEKIIWSNSTATKIFLPVIFAVKNVLKF